MNPCTISELKASCSKEFHSLINEKLNGKCTFSFPSNSLVCVTNYSFLVSGYKNQAINALFTCLVPVLRTVIVPPRVFFSDGTVPFSSIFPLWRSQCTLERPACRSLCFSSCAPDSAGSFWIIHCFIQVILLQKLCSSFKEP